MKLIDKHIGMTIITATLMVLFALIGLQIFMSFINELGDIGAGNYNLWQALQYVILTMPKNIYSFFPMAGLLGSLTGLGYLASNRELIVMRAAGVSIMRITLAILTAAIFLLIIATFLGETIGPTASNAAKMKKNFAKTGVQISASSRGLWLKKRNDFIYIENILPHQQMKNIYKYHFDANNRLLSATFAETGLYSKHHWQLFHLSTTFLNDNNTASVSQQLKQTWNIRANLSLVHSSFIDPTEIPITKLYRLIKFRKSNGLTVQQYSFVFWQRVMQPLATLVMIFLAIPFIFGPLRSVTMGLRILIGIIAGFSFYILNQFLGPFSLVYQIPPLLAAILPSIIFLAIGGWSFYRLH